MDFLTETALIDTSISTEGIDLNLTSYSQSSTSSSSFPNPTWPDCTPGERYESEINFDFLKLITITNIPEAYPTWEVALKCTAYAFAMAVGIVGNLGVILVMMFYRHMQTTTNVYILNLAISDLLLCCSCMWIHLGKNITIVWPFGQFFCRFNAFFESKCRKKFCTRYLCFIHIKVS